jgi:type I restriction enzyme S subunit
MKAGWEVRPLGEICGFQGGTQPPKSEFVDTLRPGYVRLLQIRDFKSDDKAVFVRDNGKVKKCAATDILIGRYGASVGQIHRGKAGAYNVALVKTIPNLKVLDRDYFYHFLTSDLFQVPLVEKKSRGAQDGFNQEDIAPFLVPLPPLEEQQRIVAILDEAFEGLARARTHAEANLQNARELFEAMLHQYFSGVTANWRAMTVEESLTKTKVPNKIQRKSYLDAGQFPIVSQETGLINGYWDDDADLVRIKRPVVVFGDHTRILKFVDFDFVVGADGTQIMAPRHEFDPRFYYFALKTIDLKGKGYARHFSHLKKCTIRFPKDISQQQEIADRLDTLSEHSKMLAAEYSTKSKELDALRQSLLQKAFAGELT